MAKDYKGTSYDIYGKNREIEEEQKLEPTSSKWTPFKDIVANLEAGGGIFGKEGGFGSGEGLLGRWLENYPDKRAIRQEERSESRLERKEDRDARRFEKEQSRISDDSSEEVDTSVLGPGGYLEASGTKVEDDLDDTMRTLVEENKRQKKRSDRRKEDKESDLLVDTPPLNIADTNKFSGQPNIMPAGGYQELAAGITPQVNVYTDESDPWSEYVAGLLGTAYQYEKF